MFTPRIKVTNALQVHKGAVSAAEEAGLHVWEISRASLLEMLLLLLLLMCQSRTRCNVRNIHGALWDYLKNEIKTCNRGNWFYCV